MVSIFRAFLDKIMVDLLNVEQVKTNDKSIKEGEHLIKLMEDKSSKQES
jgi:hypothetical protein